MTFRSDIDAARARADDLVVELERERAKTAAIVDELERERTERQRLEAATLPTLGRRPTWLDSRAVDYLLVALLVGVAIVLLFAIVHVPGVLLEGRW